MITYLELPMQGGARAIIDSQAITAIISHGDPHLMGTPEKPLGVIVRGMTDSINLVAVSAIDILNMAADMRRAVREYEKECRKAPPERMKEFMLVPWEEPRGD